MSFFSPGFLFLSFFCPLKSPCKSARFTKRILGNLPSILLSPFLSGPLSSFSLSSPPLTTFVFSEEVFSLFSVFEDSFEAVLEVSFVLFVPPPELLELPNINELSATSFPPFKLLCSIASNVLCIQSGQIVIPPGIVTCFPVLLSGLLHTKHIFSYSSSFIF